MEIKKKKFERMTLDVFTLLDDVDGRLFRGRALIDSAECRCTMVQNEPRGPRSKEIGRTMHARVVRRPDGGYTATFRCQPGEKYRSEMLMNEAREVGKIMSNDEKVEAARLVDATSSDGEKEKKGGEE